MEIPTIADSAQPTLARGVRLQTDASTGNTVLLFPEGILELNESAQEILTRCDGRTVTEVIQALADEYDVDPTMLTADVRETLADLQRRKLIELSWSLHVHTRCLPRSVIGVRCIALIAQTLREHETMASWERTNGRVSFVKQLRSAYYRSGFREASHSSGAICPIWFAQRAKQTFTPILLPV